MSLANLNAVDEVYCSGQRIERIHAGGQLAWQRPPKISDLYGIGSGQVPLHLRAEDAVVDASGNVTAVPNKGGAGAAYNTTNRGTNPIKRAGGLLTFDLTNWLQTATPVDTLGMRLFIVMRTDQTSGNINFFGRNLGGPSDDGLRTGVRYATSTTNMQLLRWKGSLGTWETATLGFPGALGTTLHLIEIQVKASTAQAWVDGNTSGPAAIPGAPWANFFFDRIGAGYNGPYLQGGIGDVVSLITDGSHTTQIATIRQRLAKRFGLSVASS